MRRVLLAGLLALFPLQALAQCESAILPAGFVCGNPTASPTFVQPASALAIFGAAAPTAGLVPNSTAPSTWSYTATPVLGIPATTLGTLGLANSAGGTTTLQPGATVNSTLTLQGTGTVVNRDSTDTLTHKTFDTAGAGNVFNINGNGITAVTGSGGTVALATSPIFTTPTLGAATATSINKVAITAPATSATLTIANGKTFTVNNSLTFSGGDSGTITFPTATDTVVLNGAAATLSSKTLGISNLVELITSSFTLDDPGDTTKKLQFAISGFTTGTTRTWTWPNSSDTVVGAAATQSLSSKTIGPTNSIEVQSGSFTIDDSGDNTKKLVFANSGFTTGTTRTWTWQNSSDTVVGRATTDTLTNKTFNSAGTGNTLQVSGVTVSAGQYPGTATNDSATAGNVGEYVNSTLAVGSEITFTTTTPANITSISLTAGDWDVWGVVEFDIAGTTNVTALTGAINTTSATLPTQGSPGWGQYTAFPGTGNTVSSNPGQPILPMRQLLSTTTTVFLVGRCNFTVSTCKGYGWISARRRR